MATLIHRKTGKTPGYEIRFFDFHADRLTIYLGGRRYSKQTATELKKIVETLVYYKDNAITVPDKRTLAWLESATPEIRKKLGKVGLLEIPESHTLGELWDLFRKQKTDVKKSTEKTYEVAKRRFFGFFKENEIVSQLTQTQMKQWKESLLETLAAPTVAQTTAKTKTVFNWAKEEKWITASPLEGVGVGSIVNREKDRFITMEEYCQLLDVCPCQDWRVIIALSRIGGLRCPSEVLQLRWFDVNWEKGRFYVTSSKTEHHAGKEGRQVPIFPELKTELETLWLRTKSKDKEFVVNFYRDSQRPNLGSRVRKTGHTP